MKNVHPVSSAGIRTRDLLKESSPLTTRPVTHFCLGQFDLSLLRTLYRKEESVLVEAFVNEKALKA